MRQGTVQCTNPRCPATWHDVTSKAWRECSWHQVPRHTAPSAPSTLAPTLPPGGRPKERVAFDGARTLSAGDVLHSTDVSLWLAVHSGGKAVDCTAGEYIIAAPGSHVVVTDPGQVIYAPTFVAPRSPDHVTVLEYPASTTIVFEGSGPSEEQMAAIIPVRVLTSLPRDHPCWVSTTNAQAIDMLRGMGALDKITSLDDVDIPESEVLLALAVHPNID